jgi:hypothetical protein
MAHRLHDRFGQLRISRLREHFSRVAQVEALTAERRFMHWDLCFADIFARQGGFDLILGNPPWIRVEWREAGVLGEWNPQFAIRRISGTALANGRGQAFADFPALQNAWISELEEAEAIQSFLGAWQNYPELQGMKANLYKCFLPVGVRLSGPRGYAGFLHPEGPWDDPQGGALREALYPRLRAHFQFVNEFQLFADVDHHARYSANIYGPPLSEPNFAHISNLFTPATVDACYVHNGTGLVGGYKTETGEWNTAGHRQKIVPITDKELAVFARLFDEPGTPPRRARLPAIQATPIRDVLSKLATFPERLGDVGDEFFCTQHWNEKLSQDDGTIRRATDFPGALSEWVVSGPHFFVGNPLNKTPKAVCTANTHYDLIDLETIPDSYLPRTNYVPAVSQEEYRRRTPLVPWIEPGEEARKRVTEYFRLVNREMIGTASERSLCTAIIPRHVALVHSVLSTAFRNTEDLVSFAALTHTIPLDFWVRSTGAGHVNISLLSKLPIARGFDKRSILAMQVRALGLNCVVEPHAELWEESFQDAFVSQEWAQKSNPLLPQGYFSGLTKKWTRDCALRSMYSRRMALVELDVLAATSLGLSLDELILVYTAHFSVLRQYEGDTWYDVNGRVAFTNSKGMVGVGLPRRAGRADEELEITSVGGSRRRVRAGWDDVKDLPAGTVIKQFVQDDTLPGGARRRERVWKAPFVRANREEDYRIAWQFFERNAA